MITESKHMHAKIKEAVLKTTANIDAYGGRVPPKGMAEELMRRGPMRGADSVTSIINVERAATECSSGSFIGNTINSFFAMLRSKPKVERPQFSVALIDTSYINSIVTEGESVKRALTNLKAGLQRSSSNRFDIIMTRQVYDELVAQLNGPGGRPHCDEKGRYIFTSEALSELHEAIYGGRDGAPTMVGLEDVACSEETRQDVRVMLKRRNRKGNERVGAGDASIVQYIKDVVELGDITFQILTRDTDFKKLMRGCSTVSVLKSGRLRRAAAVC